MKSILNFIYSSIFLLKKSVLLEFMGWYKRCRGSQTTGAIYLLGMGADLQIIIVVIDLCIAVHRFERFRDKHRFPFRPDVQQIITPHEN